MLLQHKNAILLQNATKLYYKMRQVFYCKMSLLYKMWVISKHDDFITKCDNPYKMQRVLQNASVQAVIVPLFIKEDQLNEPDEESFVNDSSNLEQGRFT